ncbi:MFS transporter [Nostoc minutum NIES-26]|uniref:Nitrate/nitrite transporter n=1 Tax=Nostoc minutum NIES-26 TaxID=1844469 RepID=A0A367QB80_9NOSO|nr:MFS transporter [Nostoc minutum NIES-26]
MIRRLWSFSDRYYILHLTWFAFFLSFVVWFNMAPLATTIQQDLGLTTEQLKVLAICNLALTIPARIVVGMILDRFGPRFVFSALLVLALIPCSIAATATNFNQLVWSSLATGIMGSGFVVGVRMVAEWFPPQEIGFAQGIYGGWGNFGAAAAQFTLPALAVATTFLSNGAVNWRLAVLLTGIVAALYGVVYFLCVEDTPPGKVYQRPQRHGAMPVMSANSFWAMMALDMGMWLSLGILTFPLTQPQIHFLQGWQELLCWGFLAGLFLLQTYKSWQVNREVVGSLNPLNSNFLKSSKTYPSAQRYQFRQIALLSFTYLTNFGAQLAVFSILPMFFEQTFALNRVTAGMLAAISYPFLNLVSRPSGGLISDKSSSRKWTMTLFTAGIGVGFLLMSRINSHWSLPIAIGVTLLCAYFVQAGAGATFSLVPLIKRDITGQIAGIVGAYGNVGSVVYLTVYNFTNTWTLFSTMGVVALICASLCGFFLQEPSASFAENDAIPKVEQSN